VFFISFISLSGILILFVNENRLKNVVVHLVGFSAGALLGDVFIHLMPQLIETAGYTFFTALTILFGVLLGFFTEKIVCWRHCHMPVTKTHIHSFAIMNLYGDFFHNFLDGLIIGASYLVNITLGLATTLAVVFHEIPQEIGDFGVLLHGGFSKQKAILMNFLTALAAVAGVVIAIIASSYIGNISSVIIALSIGNFIYIAGSDLIPELHKDENLKSGLEQLFFLLLGVFVMAFLLLIEK
jgi:zinc and cadmium transporter